MDFMLYFKYFVVFILCSISSIIPTHAAIVSINGYSLDSEANIVTSNAGLEWLQWDLTINQSINQALAGIAKTYAGGGWSLANNEQMASLLNSFDFGLTFDSNYRTMQEKRGPYIAGEDINTDPYLQFNTLFGNTYTIDAYASGPEPMVFSYAQFGENTATVPNRVYVQGDFYNTLMSRGNYSEIYLSHPTGYMDLTNKLLGVALVRTTSPSQNIPSVSEPNSFLIMTLFLILFFVNQPKLNFIGGIK